MICSGIRRNSTTDLAGDPAHAQVLAEMEAELRRICDPEAVDALCKDDQRRMIEGYGGPERAAEMGSKGATPAPSVAPAGTSA